MISIKILGDEGECRQMEEISRAMLEFMGLEGQVETEAALASVDGRDISAYPILLIDGRVACRGRIPTPAEVSTWLADAALQR